MALYGINIHILLCTGLKDKSWLPHILQFIRQLWEAHKLL